MEESAWGSPLSVAYGTTPIRPKNAQPDTSESVCISLTAYPTKI